LNFSGFARYWDSVRGAACFALARGLLEVHLILGDDSLFGLLGESVFFFSFFIHLVVGDYEVGVNSFCFMRLRSNKEVLQLCTRGATMIRLCLLHTT
jgi:hypothetical protein